MKIFVDFYNFPIFHIIPMMFAVRFPLQTSVFPSDSFLNCPCTFFDIHFPLQFYS